MLWSGTIYGWASLVHVLKVQGVYYDLCRVHPSENIVIDYSQDADNTTALMHLSNKVSPSSKFSNNRISITICAS